MIDNIYDGRGAFASIIEGGPHQNHTKILLKSQPGGTINNKITIFAYRHAPFGWKMPLQLPPPPYPANPNGINHPPPPPAGQYKSYFPWQHFQ